MSSQAERLIEQHLAPDESLLWAGTPVRFFQASGNDRCLSVFALIHLVGLAYFTYIFLAGAQWGFGGLLLLFLLLDIYVVFGRYLHRAAKLKQTVYGLTDQRAIIIQGKRHRKVRELPLEDVVGIEVEEVRDGVGSIRLGNLDDTRYEAWGKQIGKMATPWMDSAMPRRFIGIPEVQDVADEIRSARATRVS